jgi:hypothetical protein
MRLIGLTIISGKVHLDAHGPREILIMAHMAAGILIDCPMKADGGSDG